MMQKPIGLLILAGWFYLLSIAPAWGLETPTLSGRVVDLAKVISTSDHTRLETLLSSHESTTSNQVVVLTLSSLKGEPLEPFSHRVASEWKLGQKGTDNGVLLLVAIKERKIRIEVGYGLEGTLTDARSAQIIRHEIVPRFRVGDFSSGIIAGVQAILSTIDGTYTVPSPDNSPKDQGLGFWDSLLTAVMIGTLVGLFLGSQRRLNGSIIGSLISFLIAFPAALWLGLVAGGLTSLLVSLLGHTGRGTTRDEFMGDPGISWPGHSWPIGRSGGLGGSFGDSGGFGGGGGSFGGGGASGSW